MEKWRPMSRRVPELAERRLAEEREQLQLLGDVLTSFGDLSRGHMLRMWGRSRVRGTQLHVSVPNLEGVGATQQAFAVEKGVVLNFEGLPVAAAIGYFGADINPSLIGGVHDSSYLRWNGIDPRDRNSFPALIRALPGGHLDDENNLAFIYGKAQDEDVLRMLLGDSRKDTIVNGTIPLDQLRDRVTKRAALDNAAGFLSLAILQKYGI